MAKIPREPRQQKVVFWYHNKWLWHAFQWLVGTGTDVAIRARVIAWWAWVFSILYGARRSLIVFDCPLIVHHTSDTSNWFRLRSWRVTRVAAPGTSVPDTARLDDCFRFPLPRGFRERKL